VGVARFLSLRGGAGSLDASVSVRAAEDGAVEWKVDGLADTELLARFVFFYVCVFGFCARLIGSLTRAACEVMCVCEREVGGRERLEGKDVGICSQTHTCVYIDVIQVHVYIDSHKYIHRHTRI
jgi:hypothetical protein